MLLTSRRTLLIATGAGAGLALLPGTPAQAKPSKGLDELALRQAIEGLKTAPVVGVVASVVGPKGTFTTAVGVRDLHTNVAAKPQDRSFFASVTKAMTATLVFQEIEAGRWTINTTIDQIWPGLYPGHGQVTLGQLMNHTSGMPDAIWQILGNKSLFDLTPAELQAAAGKHYSEADLVAISRTMPWNFAPGTGYSYSNTGYVVLGMLLEHATGSALPDLLRRRIFKPAKMNQSRLNDSAQVRGPELMSYSSWPDGTKIAQPWLDSTIFWAAGGLCATAEDVTDFYGALMTGRLVGQRYVDQMITPVGAANTAEVQYGYGIWSTKDPCSGERLYGHDGAGFGSISLALSSRDGSRRFAFSWTGRPYGDAAWADSVWPNEGAVVNAVFSSTCSTRNAAATSWHPHAKKKLG